MSSMRRNVPVGTAKGTNNLALEVVGIPLADISRIRRLSTIHPLSLSAVASPPQCRSGTPRWGQLAHSSPSRHRHVPWVGCEEHPSSVPKKTGSPHHASALCDDLSASFDESSLALRAAASARASALHKPRAHTDSNDTAAAAASRPSGGGSPRPRARSQALRPTMAELRVTIGVARATLGSASCRTVRRAAAAACARLG